MKVWEFECQDGRKYYAKKGQCLSCANCTDVYWDFSNGPYMIICKENLLPNKDCKKWKPETNLKEVDYNV